MTQFLVLYRADPAAMAAMPEPTAEQTEQMTTAWGEWAAKAGSAIVDFGNPTKPASAGADASIGGYSILQADDLATLQSILDGHPHTAMGGQIEVLEITPIPGM
ncbi:YciI family protein [Gryllotalpicola reticulitermitis]|uniref:YciI family protein n=1 Tax=Gryllotalpicola reticulitermitis TaxID=1184153 RepID=A0ABV8QDU7_9MICO